MTSDTSLAPVAGPNAQLQETDIVVALSPEEMPAAQAHLVQWCDQQLAALSKEFEELEEHRLIAASNGWKLTSIASTARRAEQRLKYYRKVKAALAAGYLIVPNMPVDLLAIRVSRDGPLWRDRKTTSSWKPQRFDVPAEILPLGEGRYVDEGVPPQDDSYFGPADAKGERHLIAKYRPGEEYVEPDFPIRAVKPVVLEATQRAMALRIFDEIGTVRQDAMARGRDPIMVGRIKTHGGQSPKVATFFLAWWLDPRDL